MRAPFLVPLALSSAAFLGGLRLARAEEKRPPPASAADTVANALAYDVEARGKALAADAIFERVRLAYEVSGRAIHGLELARMLAKANDPIRALGVYRAVATTPLGDAPPEGEAQAVEVAKAELAKLLLVIPRISLDVTPRATSGLKLTLDGKPVLPEIPLMVRPGQHTVDAVANGFRDKRIVVSVAERDRTSVPVALESTAPAPVAKPEVKEELAPVAVALPPLHPKQEVPRVEEEQRGSPRGASQRMLGYIFIGWGAAALIGGGVALYLEHEHPGDKEQLLHTLSLVGFGAGSGLAILGLTVVLTAPSGTYQSTASVTRFVPSMVAVSGAF